MRIETEHEYHDRLLAILRYYESIGAFVLHVEEFEWDQLGFEWVPENQEEKAAISLYGLGGMSVTYDVERPVDQGLLLKMMVLESSLQNMVYPASYLREGHRQYLQARFILAFIHYFYYLECVHGKGKWKSREVLRAFREDADMVKACETAWAGATTSRHSRQLTEQLRSFHLSLSGDGLAELLVKMRGRLHHACRSSDLDLFDERKHEALAWMTMSLALASFGLIFDRTWDENADDSKVYQFTADGSN